jgi:predicted transcriptional regulator
VLRHVQAKTAFDLQRAPLANEFAAPDNAVRKSLETWQPIVMSNIVNGDWISDPHSRLHWLGKPKPGKSDRLQKLVSGNNAMSTNANDIKQALHALADQLPDDATWKDVVYEAYVRQEIEAGLSEARRGEFASPDEVQAAFARWGVQVEAEMD